MARAKAKTPAKLRREAKPPVEMKPQIDFTDLAPVDIVHVREQILRAVGSRALYMTRTAIADAEKGHYLAMKYLFEMVGLYPATAALEVGEEDSLAAILLRNLGVSEVAKSQETGAQTKVTKDSLNPADEPTGHAVE